jgi:3-methyl-2-oxobutanoate hydroxymethyltransferase
MLGGYKVQAKEFDAARVLLDDAAALEAAGCFSIVLECVPDAVAAMVTEAVSVPTIGIGAGPRCDGQVLVFHDLLGFGGEHQPKFVRRYAELRADATAAVSAFADDVRSGRYPSEAESYRFNGGDRPSKMDTAVNAADMGPAEMEMDSVAGLYQVATG